MIDTCELDRRLQYGPGMRIQRMIEALFLLGALFTGDFRLACVTFGFTAMQAVSPRLAPIALVLSALRRARREHRSSDLYFDLTGTRGACAISVLVQGFGLWFVWAGYRTAGSFLLCIPTASFVLAPTVGFCCGCAIYVALRDACVRFGVAERFANGSRDVDITASQARAHQ